MRPPGRVAGWVFSLGLLAAAAVTIAWQVEVGEPTRSCGSAFDSVADRSGWEVWWAHDLDEGTADRPSDLVRTRECPGAVNRRTVAAAVLGGAGLVLAGLVWRTDRSPRPAEPRSLERVGLLAAGTGVALTAAGVGAIVLLVADADSTLFLYTDRLVVAVVGLIALVPAVALALGGWALHTAVRSESTDEDADG